MRRVVTNVMVLVAVGLLTNCGGPDGNPPPPLSDASTIRMDDWDVYGTAKFANGQLTLGDTIGRDPSDQDEDNNTWNKLYDGSTDYDYDVVVSKDDFVPPITLTFEGTLRGTSQGFNDAGIAPKAGHFSGRVGEGLPIESHSAIFSLNWEEQSYLRLYVYNNGYQSTNLAIDKGLSGEYKIEWDGEKVVYFFDGNKLGEYPMNKEEGKSYKGHL